MRTIMRGIMIMGLLSLFNCRALFHRIVTGDHDGSRYTIITEETIAKIKAGFTTTQDLDRMFDHNDTQRWTFRQPFKVLWEDREYRIDGRITYRQIEYLPPQMVENGTVYGWKEQRYLTAYMYRNVVQFILIGHHMKDSMGRAIKGPLQNYDRSLFEVEKMNGFGCDRRIYEVVSLGMKPIYPEEFEKYCRPLIFEDEE